MGIELRYVLRSILKRPVFALTVILTLALGIAATSAAFSVVFGVLLEPLPYPQPEALVSVWERNIPRESERNVVSPANFLAWRDEGVFDALAAVVASGGSITGDGEPERVGLITATASFLPILGATATIGRLPGVEDERPEAEPTAVLSYAFWQRRFGGDPSILGRTIRLDERERQVIGVLDRGFSFEYAASFAYTGNADVYAPFQWPAAASQAGGRYLQVVGRLKDDGSVMLAQQRMSDLAARLLQAYPDRQTGWTVNVVPMREQTVGDVSRALYVILGAVAFVLLIACGNVANLMLTRATERQQEIAVRAAMGASRFRIARQAMLECVVLAMAGGALGLLLTYWAVAAFTAMAPDIPRLDAVRVNTPVLLFTLCTTLFAGLLFGLAPALQTARSDLATWLRGRGGSGGRRDAKRVRSALVITEIALSLILLIGAGLMVRSFLRLMDAGVGFDTSNLLTATVDVPTSRYPDMHQRGEFYDRLVESVRAIPGVSAASAITFAPLSGAGTATSYRANDRPVPSAGEFPVADIRWVQHDYHATMGIPLIEGRYFDERDGAEAPYRVVVSEALATTLWPDRTAVGERITMPWEIDREAEIIGVVRDIRHDGPSQHARPTIYWNSTQFMTFPGMTIVARTQMRPETAAPLLRAVVQGMDPLLPVYGVLAMDDRLADAVARTRFAAVSLGSFAALALLLACIGIYGVMAYVTGQRVQEFGVRIALGADRADVTGLVVRQGLRLVGIALAIGLAGAFAISRVLGNLVFDVGTTDPLTFATMSVMLGLVALAACWIPARRAARVDPLTAMRHE
jgi:putative ABC transport system permease protein